MQLVIVCACWMLKIRMSQRFAIRLDTRGIYHYFYLVLSQYQPAQLSAQPAHAPTHKQVCIAAENICSLYLRRSISRLWDQSSWLIKCSSCVNIHDLKRNQQCVQIVNESLRLCLINAANSRHKKVISACWPWNSPGASYHWSGDARGFLPPGLFSRQPREVRVEL